MTKEKLSELNRLNKFIENTSWIRNIFNRAYCNVEIELNYTDIDAKHYDEWMKLNVEFFDKKLEELQKRFDEE